MKGEGLKASTLKQLLDSSYSGVAPEGWVIDAKRSSPSSKIFKHPETGQVVVAHMGTQGFTDWGNNLVFGAFGSSGYSMLPRYGQAQKVQDAAVQRYGVDRITTIGHSQGGLQAELLGPKGRETITFNKASRPGLFNNQPLHQTQYDIRSTRDAVSGIGSAFQFPTADRDSRTYLIQPDSMNIVTEHGTEVLDRVPPDQVFGDDVYGNGLQGNAKRLGVKVKPSKKKNKKIDVYKDGELVASVGHKGMDDYHSHLRKRGKEYADKRRKAYKSRHDSNRHKKGTPGYYADQLLW